MKKVLLLMVAVLMVSSVAMADHFGVYSDGTGGSCLLGAAGQFNPNGTVIEKFSLGSTGCRFKVVFPVGTSLFGFNTTFVPVGAIGTDLSLAYGTCLSGSIVLGTINAIYGAGMGQVVTADLQPHILFTDCSFGEYEGTGGKFWVGGAGPCDEVATEASTWGQVKALYR